jgi:hypothetical protein
MIGGKLPSEPDPTSKQKIETGHSFFQESFSRLRVGCSPSAEIVTFDHERWAESPHVTAQS